MEYFIQGKKGNGKGIQAVALIKEYLEKGKPVATNLNIYLEHLLPPESRSFVYRLPDKPSYIDMQNLGVIDTGGDEDKNGLIVLDEVLSWLNTRSWNDPARKPLFEWFLHSRKNGWDVVYLGQDVDAFDNQFRGSFVEYLGTCIRLDRIPIPFVGWIISLFTGERTRLPKVFICTVRMGVAPGAPVVFRWYRLGSLFYKAYDTLQKFTEHNEYSGLSCTLPAWHVYGRHHGWWFMYKKIVLSTASVTALCSFLLFVSVAKLAGYSRPDNPAPSAVVEKIASERVIAVYESPLGYTLMLSDGSTVAASKRRETPTGIEYFGGASWYRVR